MKTEIDSKIEKLPRWAKLLLEQKDREISRLNDRVTILERRPSGSGIVSYYTIAEPIALPDKTIVTFGPENQKIRVNLERKVPDSFMLYLNGDTTIKVLPQASNAFYVSLEK